MLLLLIPVVWLALLVLVCALCLIAARADAQLTAAIETLPAESAQEPARASLPRRRPPRYRSHLRGRRPARGHRRVARGSR